MKSYVKIYKNGWSEKKGIFMFRKDMKAKEKRLKKRIFNKAIAAILAVTMLLSLTSCGKEDKVEKPVESPIPTVERVQADWLDKAILYEVNVRQYTQEGNFEEFSKHLERLKKMGVNTLWFMPIYSIAQVNKKGTLGSYYSIKDYYSVDSEFGTLEDFKALVDEAHSMGFHVILDWVANHTGWDHTWITDHPEYYLKDEEGNIISPIGQDWNDVAQLDFNNQDMRQAMIDAMKYWVNDIGVDGFRCDYAQGVPVDFWEEARKQLDTIRPIYMVAEDGFQSNGLLNNAFDSNYNFKVYDMLEEIAMGGVNVNNMIYKLEVDLPEGAFAMNFLDNHDKNTYDGTLNERFGEDAIAVFSTFMFTIPGMPLIYSGQEESLDLSLEFFEKDVIPFGTYKYSDLLTSLCTIKSSFSSLNTNYTGGELVNHEVDNNKVLAYSRTRDGKTITVVLNLSDKEQKVVYKDKILTSKVLLHGDASGIISNSVKDATLEVEGLEKVKNKDLKTLAPWEYYILLCE